MTDVRIPEPGKTAITGQWLTGQILTGQTITGDTWIDHPLELAGGSGQVYVGAIVIPTATGVLALPTESAYLSIPNTVPVQVTGMLDLPREPDTILLVQKNLTIVVDDSRTLDVLGDTGVVYTERNVTLQATDQPLELDGSAVHLTVEVILRIAVDAIIPLELDGSEHVRINPVLMPFVCLDLVLDAIVCAHQGDWTILNTFKSGERVLLGSGEIWMTPLTPADCLDIDLAEVTVVDLDVAPSDPEPLDLVPVGCDDR